MARAGTDTFRPASAHRHIARRVPRSAPAFRPGPAAVDPAHRAVPGPPVRQTPRTPLLSCRHLPVICGRVLRPASTPPTVAPTPRGRHRHVGFQHVQVRHAATAVGDHPRLGPPACRSHARGSRGDRRGPSRRRTRDRRRRGSLRLAKPRPAGEGETAALAAGAAGRACRRLLLSGTDRAPDHGDQLPRDLQRPHQRAHHGFRARVRARAARLHPTAASPRVEEAHRGSRCRPPSRRHRAHRRCRRYRRGDCEARRGFRHDRAGDRRAPYAAPRRVSPNCTSPKRWTRCCRGRIS